MSGPLLAALRNVSLNAGSDTDQSILFKRASAKKMASRRVVKARRPFPEKSTLAPVPSASHDTSPPAGASTNPRTRLAATDRLLLGACRQANVSGIQRSLEEGANVNLCDSDSATSVLILGVRIGSIEVVDELLRNEADVNQTDNDGRSALWIACQIRQPFQNLMVKALLQRGADVNQRDKNGASPLFVASMNNHVEVARDLLSNGADVNLMSENGASPLHAATQYGHVEIVRLLLSHGADAKAKSEGRTPLCVAHAFSVTDRSEIIEMLESHPPVQRALRRRQCAMCKSVVKLAAPALLVCDRCHGPRYCGPACQRAHWALGHRAECQPRPEPQAVPRASFDLST